MRPVRSGGLYRADRVCPVSRPSRGAARKEAVTRHRVTASLFRTRPQKQTVRSPFSQLQLRNKAQKIPELWLPVPLEDCMKTYCFSITSNIPAAKPVRRFHSPRGLLFILLLLTCFALSPAARAQDTIADLLSGHQWLVRSRTLGNGISLAAVFNRNNSFKGMITAPPGEVLVRTQPVNGNWYVAQDVLVLQWDWVHEQGFGSQHEEVPIVISKASAYKVEGLDKWLRLWQFDRIQN